MEKRKKEALTVFVIFGTAMTVMMAYICMMTWKIHNSPRFPEDQKFWGPVLLLAAFVVYLGTAKVALRMYHNASR